MAKNLVIFIILLGILFLGNKLREFSYSSVPNPGEVADEYSFGWVGISLLRFGYPIAWSGIGGYKDHDFQKINVDGIYDNDPNRPAFSIDKPWFDHPPLFGLITGGYSYLKGAREFVDASVILLRRPMLKIAIITTLLIFILGWRLYSSNIGFLAALLYSVIPTTVISSRLALAENGYMPLFLGALVSADIFIKGGKKKYWTIAVLLASLAILFKISGISVSLALFLISLVYGRGKNFKFMITSVLMGVFVSLGLFCLYGLVFGWETFVNVFLSNYARFYGAGAEVVLQTINEAKITTNKFLTDGWILLGWISFFMISFSEWAKKKGSTILSLSVFSYLVVLILFGSESYGWYKFPFFPFLILFMSRLLVQLYKKSNIILFTTLMYLPLGSAVHRLLGIVEFQKYVIYLRASAIIILSLFILTLLVKNKKLLLVRVFMIILVGFVIWLSIKEVYYYSIDKWHFVT